MSRRDDDEPIRRHSKKPNHYTIPLVGFGVAVGLLAVIAAVVVVFMVMGASNGNVSAGGDGRSDGLFRNPVPTADREGLVWTVRDLAKHLHSNGLIGEYEVSDEQKTAFGVMNGHITAITPNGGRVWIRKHGGKISAVDSAKDYGLHDGEYLFDNPVYSWGAFTCQPSDSKRDDATAVFSGLNGSVKWLHGRQVGR